MKLPQYQVVPHLDFFRITGAGGSNVVFKDKQVAEDVCRMLHAAHAQGVREKEQEIRDVLGIVGGRR